MIERRALLLTGASLLAAGLTGCTSAMVTSSTGPAAPATVVTAEALAPLNRLRAASGLGPVRADPALEQAATQHARAMARSGRVTHAGFRNRMRGNGIMGAAAENIASGQPSVDAVMEAWSGSRGHRTNMLGDFDRVGVALARNPASGNRPYWTMVLAR